MSFNELVKEIKEQLPSTLKKKLIIISQKKGVELEELISSLLFDLFLRHFASAVNESWDFKHNKLKK